MRRDSTTSGQPIGEDGSITSDACLIQPPAKWTMHANAWSAATERLTGITREMLDRDGLPPAEVMKRFLAAVGDRDLYSDEPQYDEHWLTILADAAGVSRGGRKLGDARWFLKQIGLTVRFAEAPHHRAEADAHRLASAIAHNIGVIP
jgi:hypothetical protein